ncbi:MAG: pro-sigmaK processing inhibitor BofA family protein [Bacillaceae bacterium]
MDSILIIGGLITLIILLLIIGVPMKPLKYVGNAVIKLTLGAIFLFVLNIVGQGMNIHIPVNLFTSFISGFLGIPGIIALVIVKLYII